MPDQHNLLAQGGQAPPSYRLNVFTSRIVTAMRTIAGSNIAVDIPLIRAAVATLMDANQVYDACLKRYASIHEAGHYIADEALGIQAGTASIRGSAFGRSWGGKAQHWGDLPLCPRHGTPRNHLKFATSICAGPIAEQLFADGLAVFSIGELAEARLYCSRAAALWGCDSVRLWVVALRMTAATVERHEQEIADIADLLDKRKRIDRGQPSVRKILNRVQQTPLDRSCLSTRGETLARQLGEAVPDFSSMAGRAR